MGAKAQIWEIKFAASAAFKTVSEDGKSRSGIKIDYKPTVIAGERQWLGAAEFTGLAIEWALFVKVGRDGAKEEVDDGEDDLRGFGGAQPQKKEVKIEKKSKKPAVLFNKRSLYDGKSAINTSV